MAWTLFWIEIWLNRLCIISQEAGGIKWMEKREEEEDKTEEGKETGKNGIKYADSVKLWWKKYTGYIILSKIGYSSPQLQGLDDFLEVWSFLLHFGKDISSVALPLWPNSRVEHLKLHRSSPSDNRNRLQTGTLDPSESTRTPETNTILLINYTPI